MTEATPRPKLSAVFKSFAEEFWYADGYIAIIKDGDENAELAILGHLADKLAGDMVQAFNAYDALLAALRAVEWLAGGEINLDLFACPSCNRAYRNSHAADCQLAAAIAIATKDVPA